MTDIGFSLKVTEQVQGSPKAIEIDIFDVIGEALFADGVSAKSVLETLKGAGSVETIKLRINSVGGVAFDGIAIYNLLVQHPAKVEVEIVGLAASAASVVAAAGDHISVAENAMVMVHEARKRQSESGTAEDHKQTAAALDRLNRAIAATYTAACTRRHKATGLRDWLAMMAGETWLSAKEAVKVGLADKVIGAAKIAAQWDLSDCAAVPDAVEALVYSDNRAVPFKAYPLKSEGKWDGSRATQRMREWALGSDGETDWAKYSKGFGWVDNEKADTFGGYKLPHHDVSGGSMVTVRSGVLAAGNALSGARGGVDIPAGEVAAVRNHLARHYKEFGMTAPWKAEADDAGTAIAEIAELLDRLPVVPEAPGDDPPELVPAEPEPAPPMTTSNKVIIGDGEPLHVKPDSQVEPEAGQTDNTTEENDMDAKILAALGLEENDERCGSPETLAEYATEVYTHAEAFLQVGLALDSSDPEEVLGKLEALKQCQTQLEAANAKNAELESKLEADERAALVDKGKADKKLTPSLVKFYAEKPVAELKAFLAVAPVIHAASDKLQQESVDPTAEITYEGKRYEQLTGLQQATLKREQPEQFRLMHDDWAQRGKPRAPESKE